MGTSAPNTTHLLEPVLADTIPPRCEVRRDARVQQRLKLVARCKDLEQGGCLHPRALTRRPLAIHLACGHHARHVTLSSFAGSRDFQVGACERRRRRAQHTHPAAGMYDYGTLTLVTARLFAPPPTVASVVRGRR
jgi:hypothetical protein